ncbi:MAG: CDP-archaeol synthase [Polyangiaceae bacterium]
MRSLATALWLTLPLVVAGVIHMLAVRRDWLPSLKRPVSERLFGPNKTVRGFVVMPLGTVAGVYVARALEPFVAAGVDVHVRDAPPIALGLVVGLGYMIAELPNSLMKRRLGIAPGELPERNRALFAFIDQADSVIGCAIGYELFVSLPLAVLGILVVLGPTVHLVVNVALYMVGLRKRPL